MKEKVNSFFIKALIVAVVTIQIITIVGILGMIRLTNGCLLRYSSSVSSSDIISHSAILQASGNYHTISSPSEPLLPDPDTYGQWVDTGIYVTEGTDVTLEISSGSVSLCQAFLPSYNPEQNTATGNINPATNKPIPIPRVGDLTYLSVLLPANLGKWANVAAVDQYDQIAVSIRPSAKPVYTNGVLTTDV